MSKIKRSEKPPVVSRDEVKPAEEAVETSDALSSEAGGVDRSDAGGEPLRDDQAGKFVQAPLELPVPGTEIEGTTERGGVRFLKRLDDKLAALSGKIFGTRFRPGEKIALLKEWELIAPLGETSPLVDIGRAPVKVRYPLLAHLIGVGGEFDLPGNRLEPVVELEGLWRGDSHRFLPPVFRLVNRRVRRVLLEPFDTEAARNFLEGVFRPIEDAWVAEIGFDELEDVLQLEENSGEKENLVAVRTGWAKPTGHATGLVYAREGEKRILYACNAGDQRESGRTIEKLEIRDLARFRAFLRESSLSPDAARELWAPRPERLGLVPVAKGEQIPEKFSRSPQKRGNCPMAARKSCQLAMLWSRGRQYGLSPSQIKLLYKMTTTGIRMEGVGAALRDGNAEFLSRVFVALLSKWDRPDCRRLAFRVADRLLESQGLDPVFDGVTDTLPFKALAEKPYVDSIKVTVLACGLDLKVRDSQGWSLLDYAKDHGNTEVVSLLRKLGA